jgi:hypothetical protein
MVLDGYKTYAAAGLAFAACLYYALIGNDPAKAYELFVAALGLVGIRSALPKPA